VPSHGLLWGGGIRTMPWRQGRCVGRLCVRPIKENPEFVVPVEQYEEFTSQSSSTTQDVKSESKRLTLKDIPLQMRHALLMKAKKKKIQLVIGKAGVNKGLLTSLKNHFRRNVVVRAKVAKNYADNVPGIAQELERRSGGIVLERAGRTILIFRGYTENEVPKKERRKAEGWWDKFEKENRTSDVE